MQIVYTTIVGSKMHGLDTPNSDEDIRHITMHPIRHVLSPFKNEQIKVKDSGGDDVESWELCHFVKHLTSGNPTCYEVIKSPLYDKSLPHAEIIRSLMPLCYDTRKICMAHCGYAEAQLKRYIRKIVEGEVVTPFEENFLRRIPKAIVAAFRVLAQGEQLLLTGDFQPVIKNYNNNLHERLMEIKLMNPQDINLQLADNYLYLIEKGIQTLKKDFDRLPVEKQNQKPDINSIEETLCHLYGVSDKE